MQDTLDIFSDLDNTFETPSCSIHEFVIGNPSSRIPLEFEIQQNFPNPFNSDTKISYTLPFKADVLIEIFDISGRRIDELVNKHQTAGKHSIIWSGTDFNGKSVASGAYFYKTSVVSECNVQYKSIHEMVMLK